MAKYVSEETDPDSPSKGYQEIHAQDNIMKDSGGAGGK